MPDWEPLFDALAARGLCVTPDATPVAVGGGSISRAWRVDGSEGPLFLKTGPADRLAAFEAEAEGLRELESAAALRVPAPLASGQSAGTAWLALEWLDLEPATDDIQRLTGERLAMLHRVTADEYGWRLDNTIGATPQPNTPGESWVRFLRDQRLGYQLELASLNGYRHLEEPGNRLLERLEALLDGHLPPPSLLHGDLWGGNHAASGGDPVVFDPAVYYGDRETDLAMARLFGGFSRAFFAAYERAWPLPAGHEQRVGLYQLYHLLNHLNLFGGGYLGQCERLLETLSGR